MIQNSIFPDRHISPSHSNLSTVLCFQPPRLFVTEAELLEEEAEINQAGGEPGKMGGLRRRRRTYSRTLSEHIKPIKQYGQDPEPRDGNMGTDLLIQALKLRDVILGYFLIISVTWGHQSWWSSVSYNDKGSRSSPWFTAAATSWMFPTCLF